MLLLLLVEHPGGHSNDDDLAADGTLFKISTCSVLDFWQLPLADHSITLGQPTGPPLAGALRDPLELLITCVLRAHGKACRSTPVTTAL